MKQKASWILLVLFVCMFTSCSNFVDSSKKSTNAQVSNTEQRIIRRMEFREDGLLISDKKYSASDGQVYNSFEYEYDENGNVSSIIEYSDIRGELQVKTIDTFEYSDSDLLLCHKKNDDIIEKNEYDKHGNCLYRWVKGDVGISTYEYSYLGDQLLSSYEEIATTVEIETDEILSEISSHNCYYTQYDADGRISKIDCYEANDTPYSEVYEYSSSGYTVTTQSLSGKAFYTLSVEYDNTGNIISMEQRGVYGPQYNYRNEYEYNGFVEVLTRYNKDGKVERITKTTRNSRGSIISEEILDEQKNLLSSWVYEYDDYGNVSRLTKLTGGQAEVQNAPERTYYQSGIIKDITCYEGIKYIPEIYFQNPPQ